MTTIEDIRLYKSSLENVDGNPQPESFADKDLNVIIHRIVMKLRENDFSLGDFDHLYINFTTCFVKDEIAPSKRSKDRYHPWYRYYDVAVSQDLFDMLGAFQSVQAILELVEKVLQEHFSSQQFSRESIHSCCLEAITQGEDMLMKFKEKRTVKNSAMIYLRYLDNGCYFPLLRVFDSENNLLLERDLPETRDLNPFGDIQLGGKKVTIKPRKNVYAKELVPMSFEL